MRMRAPSLSSIPILRRFSRERGGATAVEFAILAAPFFLMTMGAVEMSLIHLTRSSVTSAMQQVSRGVLTGDAGCVDANAFKTTFCNAMSLTTLARCTANTKIVLQELADFATSAPAQTNSFDAVSDSVDPGESESVMFLRVYHKWNVVLPLLDDAMGGTGGSVLLTSNMAFKNEPFDGAAGCSS